MAKYLDGSGVTHLVSNLKKMFVQNDDSIQTKWLKSNSSNGYYGGFGDLLVDLGDYIIACVKEGSHVPEIFCAKLAIGNEGNYTTITIYTSVQQISTDKECYVQFVKVINDTRNNQSDGISCATAQIRKNTTDNELYFYSIKTTTFTNKPNLAHALQSLSDWTRLGATGIYVSQEAEDLKIGLEYISKFPNQKVKGVEVTLPTATTVKNGLMSAADKVKLDGIEYISIEDLTGDILK